MAEGVRKRGTTWYYIFPYTEPETGQRKNKWERAVAFGYPNTEQGAVRARRKRLAEVDDGATVNQSGITVAEWMDTYIASRRTVRQRRTKSPLKSNTRHNYLSWNRLYIVPHLGEIPLRDLTKTRIDRWHADLLAETRTLKSGEVRPRLSATTISLAHSLLSFALTQAVADGLIRRNPAIGTEPPSPAEHDLEIWSLDELTRFLTVAADDDWAALWSVLTLTGLRLGEALALRWSDVDLPRASLAVNQTTSRDEDGRTIVGKPKDNESRGIALPATCVDALRRQRERQVFQRQRAGSLWDDAGYVFTRHNGQKLHGSTVRQRLTRLCEQAGLPRLTPHGLRHTHGTLLTAEGVPQAVIMDRLGHSSFEMTKRYQHVLPAMQTDAANRIEAALHREPLKDTDSKLDSNRS